MLLGTYERAGVPWSPVQHAVGLRPEPAAERPGAHRAEPRDRLRAFSGARRGRHPQGRQRPLHLRARRQSAGRTGPAACAISGWPAGSWPDSARAAASALRFRTGWSTAIPGADVWAMDVARYGDWATLAYTNAKVRENYSRRFRIRFPNEELRRGASVAHHADLRSAAGRARGVRRLLRTGARAVVRAGRRRRRRRTSPFRRSNAHAHVGTECSAVREAVGLMEISNYGKFEVTGPGSSEWLSLHHGEQRAAQSGASR